MTDQRQYGIGNYLLFFLDQIGVSEQLKKWKDYQGLVNQDPNWDREFQKSIKDTAQIRADFDGFRHGANRDHSAHPEVTNMLRTHPELFVDTEATRDMKISGQSFSDTNIWFVQTSDTEKRLFCRQMLGIVHGACGVFLQALSRGQFCRGSIALGVGTDALRFFGEEREEIFGPVLEQAHYLESKVSVYPRIVVEETFPRYIEGRLWNLNELAVGTREYATKQFENFYLNGMKDLISVDEDGCLILDYAGKNCSELFAGWFESERISRSEFYSKIIDLVIAERRRFAVHLKKPHIADKYFKLHRYLESNQEFWI